MNLFSEALKGKPVEGLPKFDPNRVVHATQSIEILKPLPTVSGEGWLWKGRYTGISENSASRNVVSTIYPNDTNAHLPFRDWNYSLRREPSR